MKRNMADRRNRPRFDIVGDMWGMLETAVPQTIREVSRGGMLVESSLALPLQSTHRLTLRSAEEDIAVDVRVQHVREDRSAVGDRRFLIGLAFLTAHPALQDRIEQWLYEGASDATVAEA